MRETIKRLAGNDRGVALATVYFLAAMGLAAALVFTFQALATNRASVWALKSDQMKSQADAGVQLGLARLARYLSALEVAHQLDGLTEERLREYDQVEPGAFWTDHAVEWKPETPDAGQPIRLVKDETPFALSTDRRSASFTITDPEHTVRVTLTYANDLPDGTPGVGRATLTTGYNDVRLRYGYAIDSTSKVKMPDGRTVERVTRVRSYADNPVDAENTIQVRLSRSLTRYNLFVENNTTPPPALKPIYSSVSYKGKVYSAGKLYLGGDPTFNASVELVPPTESLAYEYKADPADPKSFKFTDSKGTPLTKGKELVLGAKKIEWPAHVEVDFQRRIAQHGVPEPAGPAMALPPGIHPAPLDANVSLAGGGKGALRRAVYVNGDAEVVLKAVDGNTHYVIRHVGLNVTHLEVQEVGIWENPEFLVFVDGRLKIEGQVADRTKFTAASTGDLIITNDIVYERGIPNDDTVIGLLSWEGHVLVAKDVGLNAVSVKYPRNLYIHAVIMAPNGGFGAEGFDNLAAYAAKINESADRGKIFHIGSQIRRYTLPTREWAPTASLPGTPCRDTPCGWGLVTEFDTDLESTKAPPYFPANGPYTLQDRKKLRVVDIFRVL